MRSVGLDLGTFHCVAVAYDSSDVEVPARSVPSIALMINNNPIVGVNAIRQIDLPGRLIIAPKLLIRDVNSDQNLVLGILEKLAEQALSDLGIKTSQMVLTVPPAWTFEDCQRLKGIAERIGVNIIFLHEPVALLVALMNLSRLDFGDRYINGRLNTASRFLVCDWGAGTVDVALIDIKYGKKQLHFQCIDDFTDIDHGGNRIAHDVVSRGNETMTDAAVTKSAFMLQAEWQGLGLKSSDGRFSASTTNRRSEAAEAISVKIAEMFARLGVMDLSTTNFLLYGGPLESDELYEKLRKNLTSRLGTSDDGFIRIGQNFVSPYTGIIPRIRRDVLVAYGASLFGINGNVLPEFEYDVVLLDSFGKESSSIRLVKGPNLEGIQIITPPFTGVDYFVSVRQIRRVNENDLYTSISAQLRLHVRVGAVIIYRIVEAGVGFARIEAKEAKNLPYPAPFPNSRATEVTLPEKSTKFFIHLRS